MAFQSLDVRTNGSGDVDGRFHPGVSRPLISLAQADRHHQQTRRLGDRHCENILLDTNTGDVVHVDFNCLFEKVCHPSRDVHATDTIHA